MVGSDRKNLFFSLEENENRSQGCGGKQGEINFALKIGHFELGLRPTVDIALIPLVTPWF
jgi:hypothetical protein